MTARHRRTAAAVVIAAAALAGALAPTLANAAPRGEATTAATFLNGTAHNGLTISNGTRWVVMNGTRVDFGTDVRDLAWNPSGTKAAFVDSFGNLDVANPNGSGRVVVVKHVAGQNFSHPTWQVAKADRVDGIPAKDNLIFVAAKGGTTRLETVRATAHDGKPALLPLGNYAGPGETANPTTGNAWPNGGGGYGTIVYDNTHTGDVYIRDDYIRQQGGALLPGSEPALSPNGEEVVFVRSVGGHDHIFEENLGTSKPVARDLTPHATANYTEPTFSPNGASIAFRTPTGVDVIADQGRGVPVKVSSYTGLPAYRG
ncbi:PD40 domain-containing protein [Streptacidiphilus jiangxiensis]|uniref:WD40-like Beta Propeller Repeat n=1 Tax=Streptacidiphilus jiangxiensis TaxID=235985 RepID=A0A1H7J221_STRJI|nr:PD40 domain-containing protein [Streptacidiphilus jiangxiensis]SEK68000.1 WD40-like Beta Propeller Repeat [Streptacidiphilus jiangxiensis]